MLDVLLAVVAAGLPAILGGMRRNTAAAHHMFVSMASKRMVQRSRPAWASRRSYRRCHNFTYTVRTSCTARIPSLFLQS